MPRLLASSGMSRISRTSSTQSALLQNDYIMYSESQANALKTHKSGQEEVEVTIRNLPNEAKTDDILEYLSIAGPIKTYKFLKEEERYSAVLVYHDPESAELSKKYLGDRYYKGRVLTITTESKKSYPNGGPPQAPVSFDDELAKQISSLRKEDRKTLMGLLKGLKEEGSIFQSFLESKPKIVQGLLGKYNYE